MTSRIFGAETSRKSDAKKNEIRNPRHRSHHPATDCRSTIDGPDRGDIHWRVANGAEQNGAADQHGIPNPVEGYHELIKRDDVDAVYIALHPHFIIPCHLRLRSTINISFARSRLHCPHHQALEIQNAFHNKRWLDATGWLHHPRTDQFSKWVADGSLGEVSHLQPRLFLSTNPFNRRIID